MNVWSSEADERRARRPTDATLLVVAAIALGVILETKAGDGALGRTIESALTSVTFLRHVWRVVAFVAAGWAVFLLVLAIGRARWSLCRDVVLAALVAVGLMALLYQMLSFPANAEQFPVLRVSFVTAIYAVASPYVVRSFRYTAHVLLGVLGLATIALGGTNTYGVLAALCVGWIAASSVHLVVGSPGGEPSLERVADALGTLEVDVTDLRPAARRDGGGTRFEGMTTAGPVVVKVFGRDAWNGQLFAAIWRFVSHRGPGASLAVTRVHHAEHETLMSLVAARHGVAVPVPVALGKAPNGDVVLVAETPTTEPMLTATPADVDALWDLLDGLHRAGVVHRAITPHSLGRAPDGEMVVLDLSQAVLSADQRSLLVDRAQMAASMIQLAGVDTAIDTLLQRDPGDAESLLRYLQPAVMPSSIRRDLKDSEVDLDEVRATIAGRIGVEVPELEKIRRVKRSTLITTFLVGLAAMFIISTFSNLDWGEIREALQGANWWWLIFAFVMAQAPRLGGSLSMLGACRTPLPYGPVCLLQYALPFIDVAAPAAAGRIAATMRFQQRYGVPSAAAFSASIIDSGAGFAAQLLLMGLTFAITDLSLSTLGGDNFDIDFRLILIIVIGVAFVVSILLAVPAVRRRLSGPARDVWHALAVLKSPSKFALLLGGSAITELLYAVAMGLCLISLGLRLPYTSILVVTAFVRFVSGVSPIPGGVGIAEAGLTAGLVAAGVPVEFAFPAAIIYRLCTFYVPPAYGWAVLGVLRRKEYL